MSKFYELKGYWKDSKESIDGYIVCSDSFDEISHGNIDDEIFHYEITEDDLLKAIELGEKNEYEFVIVSFEEVIMNWTPEKKDEIETILIETWSQIGMDTPENYEDIVQFCYEDVCETGDPKNWSGGDVIIAFRRWIEKQSNDE